MIEQLKSLCFSCFWKNILAKRTWT